MLDYLPILDDLLTEAQDKERALMIVNAYLINKGVKFDGPVPLAIEQAAIELAQAFVKGELLAGRTEGVVVSKSANAGGVSVSKTYASGVDGQAMGQHEMIALALIQPYIPKNGFGVNVPLTRI